MTADVLLASLNAGEISRFALARVDLAKAKIATETQRNFLPHVLGPCQFRPGMAYMAGVPADAPGALLEFYVSEKQAALLVMTAAGLQFAVNDAYVTRPAVTAAVTSGDFASLTGWTISDEAGASSIASGGLAVLTGTGTNYAQIDQQITVHEANAEHALRLVVATNSVRFTVGAAQGSGEYVSADVGPGTYSFAFTPTGNFWLRIAANHEYPAYVDSITIEAAGIVSLPIPYSATEHFSAIRYDQSGDVLFLGCSGHLNSSAAFSFQQRRIERWASNSRSWGVALYQSEDGPFRLANIGGTTLTPSSATGITTLTASRPTFRAGHAGALFRVTHTSQRESKTIGALNDATDPIRVAGLTAHNATSTTTGNASTRAFAVDIVGAFVGTVTLQRSLAEPGAWADVKSYTAPTSENYDDGLDNQIIFYRLICTAYTSGTPAAALTYQGAAQNGIVRINTVTSTISATGHVLSQLGGVTATSDWAEGEWSDFRGWPGAVAFHDGRLAWFLNIKAQLSVSDAFASFDDTVEGDSGPINRTIATGGVDGIRWALSLQRLIVAAATQEISIRASAFDEPLTPTAFTARVCSTRGAAAVRPIKVGTSGIFVERNSRRVFELLYDAALGDYKSRELTRLKQEMCAAGVVDVAVQMQPDTRVWFVLADGTCAVLTYDQEDDVVAWTPVATVGLIERVAVLPGTDEDAVYFIVARTVGGITKRYIERLAKRTEAQGAAISKTSDCHVVYSGPATDTITGLSHLEGLAVVAWADGVPLAGTFTVAGGAIVLPIAASVVVAGLGYNGFIKTAKLAFNTEHGTGLTMQKRVSRVGLVMADVAWKGVRIGRDFANLTALPATYRGKPLSEAQVLTAYDADPGVFNGGWDSDSRVCIEVSSPYCATIMGLALHIEVNSGAEPPPAPKGN